MIKLQWDKGLKTLILSSPKHLKCSNCGTTETPTWFYQEDTKRLLCANCMNQERFYGFSTRETEYNKIDLVKIEENKEND